MVNAIHINTSVRAKIISGKDLVVRITNPLNQRLNGLVWVVEAQNHCCRALTLSNISICWIFREKLHLYVFQKHSDIFQWTRVAGASNKVQRKIHDQKDSWTWEICSPKSQSTFWGYLWLLAISERQKYECQRIVSHQATLCVWSVPSLMAEYYFVTNGRILFCHYWQITL